MFHRSARTSLLVLAPSLLVTAGLGATVPAQADDPAPAEAPTITGITTSNVGGGLTPYIPLSTAVFVTFTDSTPSPAGAYRVKVPGVGTFRYANESYETEGEFTVQVDAYQLPVDTEASYVVTEMKKGKVVSKSAPASFTFSYVKAPRRATTNSKKVDGQWTYRAGRRAEFAFKGTWEEGTRVQTQVWVSKGKKFTDADFTYNTRKSGDLLTTGLEEEPVMSVKIPRDLVGKYVWVSILGWKDGKGGWTYQMKPARVIR